MLNSIAEYDVPIGSAAARRQFRLYGSDLGRGYLYLIVTHFLLDLSNTAIAISTINRAFNYFHPVYKRAYVLLSIQVSNSISIVVI